MKVLSKVDPNPRFPLPSINNLFHQNVQGREIPHQMNHQNHLLPPQIVQRPSHLNMPVPLKQPSKNSRPKKTLTKSARKKLKWNSETIYRLLESILLNQTNKGHINWKPVIISLKNSQHRNAFNDLNPDNDDDVGRVKRKYGELKKDYYQKFDNYSEEGLEESEMVWTEDEQMIMEIEKKKLTISTRQMHEQEDFEAQLRSENEDRRLNKKANSNHLSICNKKKLIPWKN